MNEQVAHGKVSQVHQMHLRGTLLLISDLPRLILDLLPQPINEFLGLLQEMLLVAAQRLIAQLEQQVQEQVWQDKQHCVELSSMYLKSFVICNCKCLSHRLLLVAVVFVFS